MLHGFRFALKMIKKRPMRMVLTLLQIAVGVAAITIVLSFVFSILQPSDIPHNDLVYELRYGQEEKREGVVVSASYTAVFTDDMVKSFRHNSNYVDKMAVISEDYRGFLEYEGIRYIYQKMIGTDNNFFDLLGLESVEGSFFSGADVRNRSQVILISETASDQLFGSDKAAGKTIKRIPRHGDSSMAQELKVVGVFNRETGPQVATGTDFIVPYTIINGGRKSADLYSKLWVLFQEGKIGEGKDELAAIFNQEQRKRDNNGRKDFNLIFGQLFENEARVRETLARSFGGFIGSFAFIAFVVSFIGILSMMLVSIVERTREIGLRRALGATRSSILWQIISESIMISFMGGIIGIILSCFCIKPIVNDLIIDKLFNYFNNLTATLSLYPVLISLGGVIVVGAVAGLYPGIQAARLSPVEAIQENEVR